MTSCLEVACIVHGLVIVWTFFSLCYILRPRVPVCGACICDCSSQTFKLLEVDAALFECVCLMDICCFAFLVS